MEVRNYTPFVPIVYEHYDIDHSTFLPFILKGTFDIGEHGVLKCSSSPEPLIKADEYYGDPGKSSVRRESDFIPYKPATDVYFIDPIAYAPSAQPEEDWIVDVEVAGRNKSLHIFGERIWKRSLLGWKLSRPEPNSEIPIRFELAYGGEQNEVAFPTNPVGRGFGTAESSQQQIPAPQIEAVDSTVERIGGDYLADGLGPVARWWQPRLELAGTYDDNWLDSKWPVMPDDFNFAHFNCGSRELIFDEYLKGGEIIRCNGLTRGEPVAFALPNYTVFILMRCQVGAIIPLNCNMDTVAISLEDKKVYITWRAKVPNIDLRVLEARVRENN